MRREDSATGIRFGPWFDRLGVPRPLAWGFLGVLLSMLGEGVELGSLSPYLVGRGLAAPEVAVLLTVYGSVTAVAGWASGALSDLWGPRRVMWVGLVAWTGFQALYLTVALPTLDYSLMLALFGLRGVGLPLFTGGFLVWITAATPAHRLNRAISWFWFVAAAGQLTIGPLAASALIPWIGQYRTFWVALATVTAGGLGTLPLIREPSGAGRLAPPGDRPLTALARSLALPFTHAQVGVAFLIRLINATPLFGGLIFLPLFLTRTVGFTLPEWLRLVGVMFTAGMVANLLFGVVGDRLGWRRTVAWFGGVGCAVAILLLYYVPLAAGDRFWLAVPVCVLFGATLAGYVPMTALFAVLVPDSKGAAIAVHNLAAGAATFAGPLLVRLCLGTLGVAGMIWLFALLYLASAVMAWSLRVPPAAGRSTAAVAAGDRRRKGWPGADSPPPA